MQLSTPEVVINAESTRAVFADRHADREGLIASRVGVAGSFAGVHVSGSI